MTSGSGEHRAGRKPAPARAQPRDAPPGGVPAPARAPAASELPHPLTFFMTAGQRAAVLRALRRFDRDRSVALRRALGVG